MSDGKEYIRKLIPLKAIACFSRFIRAVESLLDSMNMMSMPSESDWHSEPWCIDTPYAYEHFSGKTIDEAFDLFVEYSLCYQEDIMFMPVLCFRYYIYAYINYLLSEKSEGDSDGASCFFGLIEFRKDDICTSEDKLRNRISEVLHHIGARQEWYDADLDIYGDFMEKSNRLLSFIKVKG